MSVYVVVSFPPVMVSVKSRIGLVGQLQVNGTDPNNVTVTFVSILG